MIILINNSKTRVGTQRAMKINKNSIKEIDNAFICNYIFIEKKKKYMKPGKLALKNGHMLLSSINIL